jgi:hypothetical protein
VDHHADIASGVMMVEIANGSETGSQAAELGSLGGRPIGRLHQLENPLHSLSIGRVRGWEHGVQFPADGLPVIGMEGCFLGPGTLPVDALQNSIRVRPKAHDNSPWRVQFKATQKKRITRGRDQGQAPWGGRRTVALVP